MTGPCEVDIAVAQLHSPGPASVGSTHSNMPLNLRAAWPLALGERSNRSASMH